MSHTKKLRKSHGNIGSIVSLLVGTMLTIAALLLWLNRQWVIDWISYTNYEPTAEVAQIATDTTMSDTGTFYFYASKPAIENAADFNRSCQRKEASSAILGCYANNRIFVYDVSNDQLRGMKEVTAAHEMLHAVYQRMSDAEKTQVNALLDKEYQKAKDNAELAERMGFYARQEPGERYNELHSIIATEFASIDPALEAHYKKYFTDRSRIVSLHTAYASVFSSLKAKSEQLLAQLERLGPQIENDSQSYNTAVKQLNNDIQAFNTKATNAGFTTEAAFNAERSRLISRANSLDAIRSRIDQNLIIYEKIRNEYNDTATSSNELYKSMDSKLAPSPSV